MDANKFDHTKYATIKEALTITGYDNPYLRKLLNTGKIKAVKIAIPGSNILRWLIDREALDAYVSRGTHTSREDGRNKYTLYATPEEFEAIVALLEQNKLKSPIQRANVKKDAIEAEAE